MCASCGSRGRCAFASISALMSCSAAETKFGWCEKHCPRLLTFRASGAARHRCICRNSAAPCMKRYRAGGISIDKLDGEPVTVRLRRGGERLQPDARRPRRSLKNLLQEARIPPRGTRPVAAFVQRRCARFRARYRNRRCVSRPQWRARYCAGLASRLTSALRSVEKTPL